MTEEEEIVFSLLLSGDGGGGPTWNPLDNSKVVSYVDDADLSNGAVATWLDRTANGNNWVAVNQATKDATGLVFGTGANEHYTCNALSSLFGAVAAEFHLLIVANQSDLTGQRTFIGVGSSSSANPLRSFRTNGNLLETSWRGDANESSGIALTASATVTPVETTGTLKIFDFCHEGKGNTGRVNGVTKIDMRPQDISAGTVNRVALGALIRTTTAGYFAGSIRAVVVCNAVLTRAELNQFYTYFNSTKGTTATLLREDSTTILADCAGSWWTSPKLQVIGSDTYVTGVSKLGTAFAAKFGAASKRYPLFDYSAQSDDHNAPALLSPSGLVPATVSNDHVDGETVERRRGTVVGDLGSLGAISGSIQGVTSDYSQMFNRTGTNESYAMYRRNNVTWRIVVTTGHINSFATQYDFINFGVGNQGYIVTRLMPDGQSVRVAAYGHPTASAIHDIYYCEIDLVSGDVKKRDGTVLANVKTGVGLPVTPATIDTVRVIPDGSRLFDVGDASDIEILIGEFNTDTQITYRYIRFDGSAWDIKDITTGGVVFGGIPSGHYNGGMCLPMSGSGGTVFLAKESGGVWTVEKHVTADGGTSWTPTVLATAPSGRKYIRPFAGKSTDDYKLFFYDLYNYGGDIPNSFYIYDMDLVGLTAV